MRVAIFAEPGEPFEIVTRDDPAPSSNGVVIAIHACGICGSDISLTSGTAFDFPRGAAMGHEYAGEIVAVGSEVTQFRVGDRVASMAAVGCGQCDGCLRTGNPVHCVAMTSLSGGFGEYVAVPERALAALPDSLDMQDGALVEPFAVGLHAMGYADDLVDASVLVIGAGAVGMACVYWARRLGAAHVRMTARTAHRASIARSLGADEFLAMGDLSMSHPDSPLRQTADIVFECVGKPRMLEHAVSSTAPRGQIISLGMCCSADHFVPAAACFKELRIAFPLAYSMTDFRRTVESTAQSTPYPSLIVAQTIGLDELPGVVSGMRRGESHLKIQVDPRRVACTPTV